MRAAAGLPLLGLRAALRQHPAGPSTLRSRAPVPHSPLVNALRIPRYTPSRSIHSSPLSAARQAIGKITPKRIAIPLGEGTSGREGMPKASVWRPIVFCIGLGGVAYAYASLYTNADTAQWMQALGSGSVWRMGREPTDRDLARAKQMQRVKVAREHLSTLSGRLGWLPSWAEEFIVRSYVMFSEWRIESPPAEVVPMAIVAGMGVIFLMWQSPRLQPFMRKWFLHRPVLLGARPKKEWANCVTLITSVVSHQGLAHYAFNSIALISFGSAAYTYLATPDPALPHLATSTHTPHFLAFLLAAGLFSSLGSHLFTNLVRLPRLLRALQSPARLSSAQALAAHQAILPSLGASGAVYGALTMTALAFPDSRVSIIFLPWFSLPIGLGVFGMVAVDIVGLIRGWRSFDHIAHLSGAAFGLIYYHYGKPAWTWLRIKMGAQPTSSTGYF
ncbi:Presenilins-associated rhomboid-like protein, mitochondrial [Vanrija pseudolonga]|uniref:Presenilins-associated rhomboid-like protein, mitochondrial n=1 Tax=Vanrija pseudolonga TaxID=143232 RepID=A0AAF1BFT6_9TREE|nr:Presenilins-associated rhomboid-like protein, mitochondrial [Vanrija pseudolonga]WOO78597.1 Presenilins-associated rhomboid-like protein, mitochondrial [Vanrija pseudolonga]